MVDKSVEQDYEALKSDISQLRNDLSSLIDSAKASGKESLAKAQSEAAERLRDGTDRAAEKAKEIGSKIETQYEEKPFMFLIGAFVIGLILGRVLDRK